TLLSGPQNRVSLPNKVVTSAGHSRLSVAFEIACPIVLFIVSLLTPGTRQAAIHNYGPTLIKIQRECSEQGVGRGARRPYQRLTRNHSPSIQCDRPEPSVGPALLQSDLDSARCHSLQRVACQLLTQLR